MRLKKRESPCPTVSYHPQNVFTLCTNSLSLFLFFATLNLLERASGLWRAPAVCGVKLSPWVRCSRLKWFALHLCCCGKAATGYALALSGGEWGNAFMATTTIFNVYSFVRHLLARKTDRKLFFGWVFLRVC